MLAVWDGTRSALVTDIRYLNVPLSTHGAHLNRGYGEDLAKI